MRPAPEDLQVDMEGLGVMSTWSCGVYGSPVVRFSWPLTICDRVKGWEQERVA